MRGAGPVPSLLVTQRRAPRRITNRDSLSVEVIPDLSPAPVTRASSARRALKTPRSSRAGSATRAGCRRPCTCDNNSRASRCSAWSSPRRLSSEDALSPPPIPRALASAGTTRSRVECSSECRTGRCRPCAAATPAPAVALTTSLGVAVGELGPVGEDRHDDRARRLTLASSPWTSR